ncbi:MAG: extracellular solute-binding protein [Ruminococcus sp.]|nr:extracellular solute-binding protein [Ruminococcus sp.]
MKTGRFLSVILSTIIVAVVFAGCNQSVTGTWKDYCFEAVPVISGGTDFESISEMAYNGDKFIIAAYDIDYPEDRSDYDNYVYHNYLAALDEKNGVIKKVEISEYYSNFYSASDGTVYAVEIIGQESVDSNGITNYESEYYVVTIDEDLNVSRVLDISEIISDSTYTYITDFKADSHGNIYIFANENAYGFNTASGNLFFTKKATEVNGVIKGFVESTSGEMNLIMYELTSTTDGSKLTDVIAEIDTNDGSLGDSVPFPSEEKTISGGKKYPYYTYNSSNIFGINQKTSEKTVIADLLASGSASLEFWDIVYVSDEKFAVYASDRSTHINGVYMLEKMDPKTVQDKVIINVAAVDSNIYVDYFIKEFNQKNKEYQVELKTYETEGSSYSDRLTAFNADFAAGNTPDVLIIDQNMDYYSYVNKNLFVDLYPLIDEAPDIKREDLVQPIMKAHETNGGLYSITPNYCIYTFMGKTEIFGEKKGQSLAELEAAAAAYPDAKLFYNNNSASDLVASFVDYSLTDYVNYTTGECYFDTPEFIALLESAKGYPIEVSDSLTNPDDYLNSIINDKTLIFEYYIADFRDIVNIEKTYFDAPVTLLEYPRRNGGAGAFVVTMDEVAILSNAKNPEGAWEFVKEFMQFKGPEDNQEGSYSKFLPIWQKHMDDLAADALYDPYYTDFSTGERVYKKNNTYINGQVLPLPNNTPEDNAKVFELIDGVTRVNRNDRKLLRIIREDADLYFRGQKSAEETAAMIQNRVSTYLAEIG